MEAPDHSLLNITVCRNELDTTPAHHVTKKPPQSWASYFASWGSASTGTVSSSPPDSKTSSTSRIQTSGKDERIGFQNPWPSWVKPNRKQVWDSLEWGEDQDPCIRLAASHVSDTKGSIDGLSRPQIAGQLLSLQEPDFTFDSSSNQVKTTWLGHAGILVQLPALESGGRPIRCIFDPMFSNRSSPSQMAGPIRSYPPPCKVEALPPIDVFMMSHNHHDHLDYDTVMALWKANGDRIRFLVPMGNKSWFIACGIDEERVTELDWWESAELSTSSKNSLKITCTPCQHNSGRTGFDANATLWSSWYLVLSQSKPYRVYFAGDTGYQYHGSLDWPPEPQIITDRVDLSKRDYVETDVSPRCPAFQEIADRLGSPDLLLLPVAVGATFSFLRSHFPLSDATNPFPRHRLGMTAANHMPPWDAVHVLKLMTEKYGNKNGQVPTAIAMHWGTFVPERTEVLKTLGQLEYACSQQGVQFSRSLDEVQPSNTEPVFLALNHGQSVTTLIT